MASHASRFAAHLAALTSGALAIIFALILRPGTSAWIVLGLGGAVVIAALSAFAVAGQGTGPRCVEILLALTGAWTVVAARVFSDPAATKWLGFADGAAIWSLGTLGLVVHERLIEARLRGVIAQESHRLALTRRGTGADVTLDRAGL